MRLSARRTQVKNTSGIPEYASTAWASVSSTALYRPTSSPRFHARSTSNSGGVIMKNK